MEITRPVNKLPEPADNIVNAIVHIKTWREFVLNETIATAVLHSCYRGDQELQFPNK